MPPLETDKINADLVDSLQVRPRGGALARCAVKDCIRAGTIWLFHSSRKGKQQRSNVCIAHALDLANEVIGAYRNTEV